MEWNGIGNRQIGRILTTNSAQLVHVKKDMHVKKDTPFIVSGAASSVVGKGREQMEKIFFG